jgi:hypothetical protein
MGGDLADFLTDRSQQVAGWEDAVLPSGGTFVLLDDGFAATPDKTKGEFGPLAFANDDGGVVTLPPGDSVGREMTDAEIEAIIDGYIVTNSSGGGSGNGGGGGTPSQNLGPDLTIYDCQHLANLEEQILNSRDGFRALAISALSLSNPFQGEQVFNDILSGFQALHDQGLYTGSNLFSTLATIGGQNYTVLDFIDLSVLGVASNVTVAVVELLLVQSYFSAQLNLDRIDAEQARRGVSCGA